MPWKNITSMEEIIRFVMLAQTDRFTITELCEQFGISRKTGYKHLERYAANGLKGLQVRSHRPREFPQRTAETGSTGSGRSMFVRLGGRVGRLVSAVPNIERPDPVCRPPIQGMGRGSELMHHALAPSGCWLRTSAKCKI